MADKLTKERRSRNMAAIRSKDMKPELIVRRLTHGLGYRYRLHASDLPGKPDLVFRSRRKVIFVHGCFWHLHPKADCLDARQPKSNMSYWTPKLASNVERDKAHVRELRRLGWRPLIVWECETRDTAKLKRKISSFLKAAFPPPSPRCTHA